LINPIDDKMTSTQEIKDLPAILFPHSWLPEASIKKILTLLGPFTVYQPWFMERPAFISETNDSNPVRVMNPPEQLKPAGKFLTLLSEYRTWIRHNHDRSYTEFIKTAQGIELAEDNTWEIRQMLRRMNEDSTALKDELVQDSTSGSSTFKWHLVLHLAREIEEQRFEADKILNALKKKNSPLEGSVEDTDHVKGIFEDLPRFDLEPVMDTFNLEQIFEAWFSLFGEHLEEDGILITINHHVMDYVSEFGEDLGEMDKDGHESIIKFRFRRFSGDEHSDEVDHLQYFSNRTLILMKDV